MAYKFKCRLKSNKAKHEKEGIGDNCHVTKIEASLDHAIHGGTVEKVEERISIDEGTSGAPTKERAPPPAVVLSCKLEVHERNRNEGGHLRHEL